MGDRTHGRRPAFSGCDAIVTLPRCGRGGELALLLPVLVALRGRFRSPG
jgi:hypothetical protein